MAGRAREDEDERVLVIFQSTAAGNLKSETPMQLARATSRLASFIIATLELIIPRSSKIDADPASRGASEHDERAAASSSS